MQIKDVENLAKLARIELGEDEKRELLSDMEGILDYVKQIERPSADVDCVESIPDGTSGTYNVWREDVRDGREFSDELIKKQFPDSQDGFLKVKKIL